jgi:hypothetical protein
MKKLKLNFDRTFLASFIDFTKVNSEPVVLEIAPDKIYTKIHTADKSWVRYSEMDASLVFPDGGIEEKVYIPLLSLSKVSDVMKIMAMKKLEHGVLVIPYDTEDNAWKKPQHDQEPDEINAAPYVEFKASGFSTKIICPEVLTVDCLVDQLWDRLISTEKSVVSMELTPDHIQYISKLASLDSETFMTIISNENGVYFMSIDKGSFRAKFDGNYTSNHGSEKVEVLVSKSNFLDMLSKYKDMIKVDIVIGDPINRIVSSCNDSLLVNTIEHKS